MLRGVDAVEVLVAADPTVSFGIWRPTRSSYRSSSTTCPS